MSRSIRSKQSSEHEQKNEQDDLRKDKHTILEIITKLIRRILDPINQTAIGLSLILIYFEILNYFTLRTFINAFGSMLISYSISVIIIILYSIMLNYYVSRSRIKSFITPFTTWFKHILWYRATNIAKIVVFYSLIRFAIFIYVFDNLHEILFYLIFIVAAMVILLVSLLKKAKAVLLRMLIWINIVIFLMAPLTLFIPSFINDVNGISFSHSQDTTKIFIEFGNLKTTYYGALVVASIILIADLLLYIAVFVYSKVLNPGLKLHIYIHNIDHINKYNLLGLTELAIIGNIVVFFLVYRNYVTTPLYIGGSVSEVSPFLILAHNIFLILFMTFLFHALVYGIYVYYTLIMSKRQEGISIGYNVNDWIIYPLYTLSMSIIIYKLYIMIGPIKSIIEIISPEKIPLTIIAIMSIAVGILLLVMIENRQEIVSRFFYAPGWKTMITVLLVPILLLFAADYAWYMAHVVTGASSLDLAISSDNNCTIGGICIPSGVECSDVSCTSVLDVVDLNYLIFITMTLRFGVAILVITSLFAIAFLYLKRNLIPHFIYYLVDKNILFGLISATLVALIPLELEFNAIRDSFLNYLPRLLVFPALYSKTIMLNSTVYRVDLIEELSTNGSYYSPSILGALVTLTLYMVVISSLSVFIVSIYRVDKHFDHSILEYIKRHIGNLLSRTSKVRLIVAGYGSLGEFFIKTILSYNVLENLLLLYYNTSNLRNTRSTNSHNASNDLDIEKQLRKVLNHLFVDEIDIIMILDFRRTSFGKVDYRVSLKNVVIVEKSPKEWYYAIKHDVLNYIGLKYVKYSYGEGVYVPVIVNDITNEVVLSYLRILSRKSRIREEEHLTLLYLLIDNPNDVLKILIKLDNFKILKRNDIFIITRAFSSPETQNMLSELIKGHLQYVYLDYYMGHILFGNLLPHLINNYKKLKEVKIYPKQYGGTKPRQGA